MVLEQVMATIMGVYEKYASADGDCSSLSQPELLKLIKAEFPTLCQMQNGDATLMEICKELDFDGNKKVDFKEYGMFLMSLTIVMQEALHAKGKGCKK